MTDYGHSRHGKKLIHFAALLGTGAAKKIVRPKRQLTLMMNLQKQSLY